MYFGLSKIIISRPLVTRERYYVYAVQSRGGRRGTQNGHHRHQDQHINQHVANVQGLTTARAPHARAVVERSECLTTQPNTMDERPPGAIITRVDVRHAASTGRRVALLGEAFRGVLFAGADRGDRRGEDLRTIFPGVLLTADCLADGGRG